MRSSYQAMQQEIRPLAMLILEGSEHRQARAEARAAAAVAGTECDGRHNARTRWRLALHCAPCDGVAQR